VAQWEGERVAAGGIQGAALREGVAVWGLSRWEREGVDGWWWWSGCAGWDGGWGFSVDDVTG
jgi:hypothetical protein